MNNDGKKGYVILNGSVAKQVANILTNKIIEGEYAKGSYLPTEEVLCTDFGLGRSSVREAIKTLESRGLVHKIQGKGVEIIDNSVEATSEMLNISLSYNRTSLKDLMDFRVALEMKNVEWATKNATDEDIASMQQSLDMMKKDDFNSDDFATYDYMFHEAIAKASGNGVSLIMIKALQPLLYKQIVYTLDPNFNPENANHLHEYIFEAIKLRDTEKAIKTMYDHLCETQRIISDLDSNK